jgi:hypothetical protein
LPDWYFQQIEYPVLWSEIELTIPSYWEYNVLLQGYESLVINTAEEVTVPAPFLPARDGTDPVYKAAKRHYAVQNIPALREYEHTNSLKNYLSKITFDIASYLSPHQSYRQNFATTCLNDFNYVIVNAEYEGKSHLLDAAAAMSSIGQLPTYCFNEKGFCVKDKKTFEWLSLMPDKSAAQMHRYEMKLAADGSLEGVYKARYTNTEAMLLREALADMKPDDIKQYWLKKHKGLTIKSFKITNLDTLSKPINIEAEIKIEGKTQVTDKIIYLNPIFYDNITENPFKAETRRTPIHYKYIFNTDISVKIDIPEGYIVDELPKNTTLVLADNSAKASINFASKPNQIELSSKIAISQHTFKQSTYLDLREWYNVVIAKQSEQIVLKIK